MLQPASDPPPELSIRSSDEGGVVTLALDGSLDAASAATLRQELIDLFDRGCRRVVLDLSNVYFLDSTGLGVLVGGLKRFRSGRGELALGPVSRAVRQLLEVTGLDKVFASGES